MDSMQAASRHELVPMSKSMRIFLIPLQKLTKYYVKRECMSPILLLNYQIINCQLSIELREYSKSKTF